MKEKGDPTSQNCCAYVSYVIVGSLLI